MRYFYKTTDNKGLLNVKTPLEKLDGYVQITEEEFNSLKPAPAIVEETAAQKRIKELKSLLKEWDYKTSKHVDGEYTDEQWAEIVAQRKAWREEIRELEEN